VIGHVTAAEVAEHAVEVEAQIDPGGLETVYEVRLVWQEADPKGGPTNDGERPSGGAQTPTGHIAAGSGDQAVSATLAGLRCGYTYWYVVTAVNSAGRAWSLVSDAGQQNQEQRRRSWDPPTNRKWTVLAALPASARPPMFLSEARVRVALARYPGPVKHSVLSTTPTAEKPALSDAQRAERLRLLAGRLRSPDGLDRYTLEHIEQLTDGEQ
jgi:hypothetical protein